MVVRYISGYWFHLRHDGGRRAAGGMGSSPDYKYDTGEEWCPGSVPGLLSALQAIATASLNSSMVASALGLSPRFEEAGAYPPKAMPGI